MQKSSQQLTVADLQWRVRCHNGGHWIRGGFALSLAVSLWLATLDSLEMLGGLLLFDRFHSMGVGSALLSWLFYSNRAAFFQPKSALQAPALRNPVEWEWRPISLGTLAFGLVVAAPLMTGWACSILRSCCFFRRAELETLVETACFLRNYLAKRDSWAPYPVFESQRRAIQLLETLGLVRVSRRFGRLQVRAANAQDG